MLTILFLQHGGVTKLKSMFSFSLRRIWSFGIIASYKPWYGDNSISVWPKFFSIIIPPFATSIIPNFASFNKRYALILQHFQAFLCLRLHIVFSALQYYSLIPISTWKNQFMFQNWLFQCPLNSSFWKVSSFPCLALTGRFFQRKPAQRDTGRNSEKKIIPRMVWWLISS